MNLDLRKQEFACRDTMEIASKPFVVLRPGDLWFCCSESSYAPSALYSQRSILADLEDYKSAAIICNLRKI